MIKCFECQKEFSTEGSLHKHLKSHKISIAFYYQKHEPRYDLYTGKLIKFKSKEYYFNTKFNDKSSLKKWLDKSSSEEKKNYIIDFLKERKEKKNLLYTPCQNELKTLMVPGISYINDLFGCYYTLANSLGFLNRFKDYKINSKAELHHNKKIIIDTREQSALKIKNRFEIATLKFGDYKLKHGDNQLVIERKALNDFYSTLGFQCDRFIREIERSVEKGYYMIVLIEAPISDVYAFPHLPYIRNKMKLGAEVVLHNMRNICQKYKDIQFLFVDGRSESERVIEKLFACSEEVKSVDLQLVYDRKEL
jgi:hypothetical protein